MALDSAIISALAALAGSATGALAPILSNYVLQRGMTQRELLHRQMAERQTLYSDFIKDASSLYAHSMTHSLEEVDAVVALFSLAARIRLLGSEPVITAAEYLVRQVVANYGEPNLTTDQMRAEALSSTTDPLYEFSTACRTELAKITTRGVAQF